MNSKIQQIILSPKQSNISQVKNSEPIEKEIRKKKDKSKEKTKSKISKKNIEVKEEKSTSQTKQIKKIDKNKQVIPKQFDIIKGNYEIEKNIAEFDKKFEGNIIDRMIYEKKLQCFNNIKNYEIRRTKFYKNHIDILNWIQERLLQKIEETQEFFQETLKYFTNFKTVYEQFGNSLDKINFDSILGDKKTYWYPSIKKGILLLTNYEKSNSDTSKQIFNWIQSQFLVALRKSLKKYISSVQYYHEKIYYIRKICQKQKQKCDKKYQQIQRFIKFGDKSPIPKIDLFSDQILLIENENISKQKTKEWGDLIIQFMILVQTNQTQLFVSFHKQINEFYNRIEKFHKVSTKLEDVINYWKDLQINQKNILVDFFLTLLKQQHIRIIQQVLKGRIVQTNDVYNFFSLSQQQQIIEDPFRYLEIIYMKRFKVKVNFKKNEKLWNQAYLYYTVDGFLVIISNETSKIINKMLVKHLKNERLSQFVIALNQKIIGILIDSWNTEIIHFNTIDQTQQFIYLTSVNKNS